MPSYWPLIVLVLFAGLIFVLCMLYADKQTEEILRKNVEKDAEILKKQRDVKPSGNVLSAIDRLRKNR